MISLKEHFWMRLIVTEIRMHEMCQDMGSVNNLGISGTIFVMVLSDSEGLIFHWISFQYILLYPSHLEYGMLNICVERVVLWLSRVWRAI